MDRGFTRTWTYAAALTALAIGPACDGDFEDDRDDAQPQIEEGHDALPEASSHELTTLDHTSVVPGFDLQISLGGNTGEDVLLDWPHDGFTGDVIVYRSTNPHALLDISAGAPLDPSVQSTTLYDTTNHVDSGAASMQVQTPHYYYRVGRVQGANNGNTLELSTMVMKTTTASFEGYTRLGLCMLDGPQSASELYTQLGGDAIEAIWGWDAANQSYLGWFPDGGGVDFPLEYGSSAAVKLDNTTAPFRSLVGVVPTNEQLIVSGQQGTHWTILPVFYDGPTNASFWVGEAGYWGVGKWSSQNQSETWYWNSDYQDFEMEACGSYTVELPDNACASSNDCNNDEFCHFVDAAACGNVAAGKCLPRPLDCENCDSGEICGCDGQTYASKCEAHLVGVSMDKEGACAPPAPQCELAFGFEPGEPDAMVSSDGDWQSYTGTPLSYDYFAVPFGSTALGTDGNRKAPYPSDDQEHSAAILDALTLGTSLSLRSWHVDEGGGPDDSGYDSKRVFFDTESPETGLPETWVLVDCSTGFNMQAFCDYNAASRPGDLWDEIVLPMGPLAGRTGNLRFEYDTIDDCCGFEQGWFIDDISVGDCGQPTGGVPELVSNECPAACLELDVYQDLVADTGPGVPEGCDLEDYGIDGSASIHNASGEAYVVWNAGSGTCRSSSPNTGIVSVAITSAEAKACADLIEAKTVDAGLVCNLDA